MLPVHKIVTFVHSYLIDNFPGGRNLWFSLRDTTYQNNSLVNLDDIGEGDEALLCKTDLTVCCNHLYGGAALGNWFYPNGTRVPSEQKKWDFHRVKGTMMVLMNRRRGGVEGIYRCEIPDAINVHRTIYIGVYTATTGE